MKKVLFVISSLLFLTSCSNWQYKEFTYLRCKKLDKIHAHLYYHETCEWNCLSMSETYTIVVDTAKVKYKVDKNGEVKKVKLIK
jgi:hypothetical protein